MKKLKWLCFPLALVTFAVVTATFPSWWCGISDISEFRTLSAQLPVMVKRGNPEFCKLVTARYQQRVEAALARANPH